MGVTLVLGGASSGKSRFAEEIAARFGSVTYIATAAVDDNEMSLKVAEHQKRRPAHWRIIEATGGEPPVSLTGAKTDLILFDSVTLYVSGIMAKCEEPIGCLEDMVKELRKGAGEVVLVSDEIGQGVVPPTKAGRRFRDLLGLVNQKLAETADNVYFVIAGVPLLIKGGGGDLPAGRKREGAG